MVPSNAVRIMNVISTWTLAGPSIPQKVRRAQSEWRARRPEEDRPLLLPHQPPKVTSSSPWLCRRVCLCPWPWRRRRRRAALDAVRIQNGKGGVGQGDIGLRPEAMIGERRRWSARRWRLDLGPLGILGVARANAGEGRARIHGVAVRHLALPARGDVDLVGEALEIGARLGRGHALVVAELLPHAVEQLLGQLGAARCRPTWRRRTAGFAPAPRPRPGPGRRSSPSRAGSC